MPEIAEQIVDSLEPSGGWWKTDTRASLVDVATTMLDDMDQDSVEECMRNILGVAAEEYGE